MGDNHSLSKKVFHKLQEDILSGKYAVDEELKEKTIGDELGVSRTPVREALRQLELQGLVTITPNKGAHVTGFSKEDLNDIYEIRDSKVKKVKESGLTGEAKNEALKAAENEKDAALYRSHFAFPANLSLFLDERQIEAVKDGMTYGVVKVTYDSHLDMIPTLKDEEKAQIYAWLVEAREFALDAENSNKKHAAFGKYKGRINNYLAKRGYDLKKEREEWYKRVKARGGSL